MFSIVLPNGAAFKADAEDPLQPLRGGSLKAAFLGKHKQAELNLQVVYFLSPLVNEHKLNLQVVSKPEMRSGKLRKVLSVSDSRDSTSHWMIKDTKLVELIKRGCQPVISASAWTMEMQGEQPTLNIER